MSRFTTWLAGMTALILASAPALAAGQCGRGGKFRAMTYNIRLDTPADGPNRWELRRDLFIAQIRLVRPALLGLQEVVPGQYADLKAALPDYAFVGGGRDDGMGRGEASPLAIERRTFAIVGQGMFWLSPTPERPSMGWDAAYPRIASWARLVRRADGARLLAINTHWDHVGLEARRNSALQLQGWIKAHQRSDEAVVLLGDFNAPLSEASLASLTGGGLTDARAAARESAVGSAITFNGFDPMPKSGETIDHILVSEKLGVMRYHVLGEHFDGRVASDHFAVVSDLFRPCPARK